ncbi:helix-turn-helix transcriptional regulator [Bailinhaonella thermotolerans]|uniref:helix-turn-helix transcriptional regulator n=1 Tax=Bailinhaonella thermotolerans TaxID=1070861 RepID=UPI00192A4751|nr:WYL domain-containing protein [Bailinhaonella thermotolerans]
MSRRKTERLLNLVICLLHTRRPLTAVQIRQAVPGYPEGDEAFQRMFERDKGELRELGIPIEVGADPWDDEPGYRIPRQAYELPEITIEPDEAAVLGLAAQVWRRAGLAEAASGALLKLRAAGAETEEPSAGALEFRVDTRDPAFPALWEAVRDRRPVAFHYRTAGHEAARERVVEPWGVVSRRGKWYLAGHDRDRDEPRVFRLSRIEGQVRFAGRPGTVTVPEGVNVREMVVPYDRQPHDRVAVVRLREGACEGLRHRARDLRPDGPGWDRAELVYADTERFAGWVVAFGADAEVVEPPDAREAVIRRLKGALSS